MAFAKSLPSGAPRSRVENTMRPMLFPVCRHGRHSRWAVLVEGRPYGEYLDREAAVLDAIEAVKDAAWERPRSGSLGSLERFTPV